MNHIYRDYLGANNDISPYFAEEIKPNWPALCEKVIASHNNEEVIKLLIDQNVDAEHDKAKKNTNLLKKENTLIVITGQQLGIFVSPLYTIYKALTTIRLAEQLSQSYEKYNFVPVFWLEGEDHDFAEVKHFQVWGKDGKVQSEFISADDAEKRIPMHRRQLDPSIEGLIANLSEHLQPTEFTEQLFSILSLAYQPGGSWLEAFRTQLKTMLESLGILFFNPSDHKIKTASKPFFEQLIEKNDQLLQSFQTQSNSLLNKGYFNQVKLREDLAYIFMTPQGGEREHLYSKEGGAFATRLTENKWTKAELQDTLKDKPEWFSSTVLTRPLWQSWLLPVVSYVAGPAEIAYWAQLKSAFVKYKIQMPHLQPRASFTLVEPAINRLLKKYNIAMTDVSENADEFRNKVMLEITGSSVEDEFEEIFRQIELSKKQVSGQAMKIDPTLKSTTEKTFNNINNNLNNLQSKLVKALQNKETQVISQLARIQNHFYPGGSLQERTISSVYFSNKYGDQWLKEVYDEIDLKNNSHKYVQLG